MALNAENHFEEAGRAAIFLAEEITKNTRICSQYLRKSTTNKEALYQSLLDAHIAVLEYAVELKRLANKHFLGGYTFLYIPAWPNQMVSFLILIATPPRTYMLTLSANAQVICDRTWTRSLL
jgi:hypothetical protein